MKIFCAVGAVGVAGCWSAAHGFAICECSVVEARGAPCADHDCRFDVLVRNALYGDVPEDLYDFHIDVRDGDFEVGFQDDSDSKRAGELGLPRNFGEVVGVFEYGSDLSYAIASPRIACSMGQSFGQCLEIHAPRAYPDCHGPRSTCPNGDAAVDFYAVANMITWTVVLISTSGRLPM